jgi:hypothetical protein
MIPRHIRQQLPKAKLVSFMWWRPMPAPFTKFRLANAIQIHLWRLVIIVRAPYLERPARQLFPHLFKEPRP